MSDITGAFSFLADWHDYGFWHAATGHSFKDSLINLGFTLLDCADLLIVGGVGLVIFAMLGSKRAKKWLWWDVIFYLIAKLAEYALTGGLL